jgi:glucosyl-3-phosphoglycerate phosphatase
MTNAQLPGSGSGVCLLRHGQSDANVLGLIASTPAAAGAAFGLTALGRQQVREAVVAARDAGWLVPGCTLISSPLLRARESAAVAAEVLGATVHVDARLSERGFGTLELASDTSYEQVWSADRLDPAHEQWGVESATSVLARVTALLREWRVTASGFPIVLCTHGDVASVLICATEGVPLSRHRDVGGLENGEVRRLAPPGVAALSGLPVA